MPLSSQRLLKRNGVRSNRTMNGFPVACVGEVTEEPRVTVTGLDGNAVVDADILRTEKGVAGASWRLKTFRDPLALKSGLR